MATDTKQVNFPHNERTYGIAAQARHFIRHLLEMVLAMSLGMVVGGALALWAARIIGYSDPLRQIPEVSALVMAFNMAAPMAAWMRHRGMEWSPIAEMSGAMFVEVILLIGVIWIGILSKSSLVLWQHALMIPAMVVPMLYYRRDLYTGHVSHHAYAH